MEMGESSNIFVITLGDAGNPIDDLGQIHSIGALPLPPFEVFSSPGGLPNDQEDSPRPTEVPSVAEETLKLDGGRDGLLSPVLRIQRQEKACQYDNHDSKNSLVLQQFFDISYCVCTSPMKTSDRNHIHCFRKACFGILVTLSILDSIISMNYSYMNGGVKDFHRYTEMGFHGVNILCKLYHVKTLVSMEQKFCSVTRRLLALEESFLHLMPLIRQPPMELPGYKSLVVLVGVTPIVAAILMGVFGFWALNDWSWKTVLYFGAMDIGRTLVVWKQGMLEAGNNKTEELLFVYNPDSVWIALGSFRLAGKVAAELQRFAMCNMMLALSVSLFKHTKPLTRVFKLLGNQLSIGVTNSQIQYDPTQFEEAWKYYFRLRKTSVDINIVFGGVIKCEHITNMFHFLVILLDVMFSQQTVVSFSHSIYEIVLMLIFYIIATKVNKVNDLARKWIKDNTIPTSPIEVNTRTLHVLLDDIKQAPIGLGTGNFLVDGGFIPRVLGLLASLLAFMVESGTDTVTPA